ncbi:MAG: hypothetical protein JEZ08_16425 [Clostridiales bacterium]|nr:hypothetical protein [Clostridiales bacterium]
MIRYPLYRGGFIVLPSSVVKALYIIEGTQELIEEEQIEQLDHHIDYEVKSNDLQSCREIFMTINNIKTPDNTKEVLEILYSCKLIHNEEDKIKVDYDHCIEFTNYSLNEVIIDAINEVKEMFKKSDEMNSYINTLDLTDINKSTSEESHVIMTNTLLDNEVDIKTIVNRTSFIKEISDMKKRIREVSNEKNN